MSVAGRMPDFVCVGAMRCGTTTLWELLARHPRVYLPETKELHFFDDRDGALGQGLEAYAAHFATAPAGAVCGESSPSYLFVPGTAERIAAVLPDARLLAILRDPVARAWSQYWFNVRRGREWLRFEEAIEREEARTRRDDPRWQRWFAYVGRGRYAEQLRRYDAVFGREQLLVLFLDELLADPGATMARVFGHIGLDAAGIDTALVPARNQLVRPRWRALHRVSSRVGEWGGSGSSPAHGLARAGAALTARVNLSSSVPPMRADTRARLVEVFADGNDDLCEWLGRPVPWAARPAVGSAR